MKAEAGSDGQTARAGSALPHEHFLPASQVCLILKTPTDLVMT